MVILIAVIIIFLFSFLLALLSLRGMKMEKEVRRVKNELAHGRVIFGGDAGQKH